MKQQTQEIYEKIRSILSIKVFEMPSIKQILNIKVLNIHIFWCISLIYTLEWIIFYNSEIYMLMKYPAFYYQYKDFLVDTLEYLSLIYSPLIIIYIFDFIVKRLELTNKIIIKIIRILLIILIYMYLILWGMIIAAGRNLFQALGVE